ncbi:EamA family transporter [candidate division KSB1 bacterium]
MNTRFKLIISLLSLYFIWGSTYLAIRFSLETIPPFMIGGIRFITAGILLFSFIRITTGRAEKITLSHWRSAVIIGGMLLFIGNGSVIWAEQTIPSGLAALIISTTPLFMVLTDWIGRTAPILHIRSWQVY